MGKELGDLLALYENSNRLDTSILDTWLESEEKEIVFQGVAAHF